MQALRPHPAPSPVSKTNAAFVELLYQTLPKSYVAMGHQRLFAKLSSDPGGRVRHFPNVLWRWVIRPVATNVIERI
jgi:hypothetical protein